MLVAGPASGFAATSSARSGGAATGFQPPGVPNQCSQFALQYDGWTRISPSPSFTQPMLDYAVQADTPQVVYETDGARVTRSANGGCTSHTVYIPPVAPVPVASGTLGAGTPLAGNSRIVALEMAPNEGKLAMALIDYSVAGTPLPRQTLVGTSSNGFDWTTGQSGAALLGSPLQLTIANQNTAYVLTQVGAATMVWASQNAGALWSSGATGQSFTGLTVDPNHPNHLYGWGETGLFESGDSGVSFTKVAAVDGAVNDVHPYQIGQVTLIEVAKKTGGLQQGIYNPQPGATVHWSRVRGPRIQALDRTPGLGLGAPLAYIINDFVTDGSLYFGQKRTDGSLATSAFSPSGAGRLRHPQASEGGWLQVEDPTGLWRARVKLSVGHDGVPFPELSKPSPRQILQNVNLGDTTVKQALPASLLPARQVITLKPGQRADAKLTLDLPAVPTPLDVMFLVDTTSSMQPTIDGLRTGIGQIITDFAHSGIDVHFGVADFQDYPVSPWGCPGSGVGGSVGQQRCDRPDHIYERLLPVSAPGPALANALRNLTLNSGGDSSEGALGGVYQAVTGNGQLRNPAIPGSGYYARPDQGANFRSGAVKVLVVATDARFHVPSTAADGAPCVLGDSNPSCNDEIGYPGPTFATVIAALNARNIRVLGLDVSGLATDSPALRDEGRLSRGTSTFAPKGGVDCNGDGHPDLPEGAPLSCPIETTDDASALKLAPSIVALLRALRDLAAVQFSLVRDGAGPTVGVLSPALVPHVDVKANNLLHVDAALACPSGADSEHPMRVLASIRGETIAASRLTLDCIAAKKPPHLNVVIPPLVPPFAVAPNPAPPPPANPNPNPNPQLNAQPGAATQQEDEPEVAVAGNEETTDEEEGAPVEMSMSALSDNRDKQAPMWAYELALLGAMSAAAVGFGVKRNRRYYLASSEVRDSRTTVTRI